MKRLMKKKVNVFGKSVPVFAIVLLSVALVSAALVPYLSNMVTGTMKAESPIEQKIALGLIDDAGSITLNTLDPITLNGGGIVELSVKTTNLAAKEIQGDARNIIQGDTTAQPLESNCGELSKLLMRTESVNGTSWPGIYTEENCTGGFVWEDDKCWGDALATPQWWGCTSNDTTMTIRYGNYPNTWNANEVDITQVKAEFKINAIGTYNFESQIMVHE